MATALRVVVVGEGPDEHGETARGPDLQPICAGWKEGALVTLVRRTLTERFNRASEPLCWATPIPSRTSRHLSPAELLMDRNCLPMFLRKLLDPLRREPETRHPADLVILSMDGDKRTAFERALACVLSDLRDRVIPVVFEPEFEVLFTRSKHPLEKAFGLQPCSTQPPRREGDLKTSLEEWLRQNKNGRRLDCGLRQEIARHLDVSPGSELEEVRGWRVLVEGLSKWRG